MYYCDPQYKGIIVLLFTVQKVHVQTNEDALCEEVQTDEILTRDKWTQKPVHISVGADNQLPGPQDYMGVGGDMDPIEFSTVPRKNSNTGYLTTFLTSASQVQLINICINTVYNNSDVTVTTPTSFSLFSLSHFHLVSVN